VSRALFTHFGEGPIQLNFTISDGFVKFAKAVWRNDHHNYCGIVRSLIQLLLGSDIIGFYTLHTYSVDVCDLTIIVIVNLS
jgi:hypothetical protein